MTGLTIKRPRPAASLRVPVRWSRWSGSVSGGRVGAGPRHKTGPNGVGTFRRGARCARAGVTETLRASQALAARGRSGPRGRSGDICTRVSRSSRFRWTPAEGNARTVRYELDERRHGLTLPAASGRDGGIAQIYARVGSATEAWAAVADRARDQRLRVRATAAADGITRGVGLRRRCQRQSRCQRVRGRRHSLGPLDKNHPGRVTRDHRSVLGDLARHGDRHRAADTHRRVRAVAGVRRPPLPGRRCRRVGEPLNHAARVLCSAGSLSTAAHGAQSLPST